MTLWANNGRPNTPNHIRDIGRNARLLVELAFLQKDFLASFQYESEAA